MIDTNEVGQKKLSELVNGIDTVSWTAFEQAFLEDMLESGLSYSMLTTRQKNLVGNLYEKLMGLA